MSDLITLKLNKELLEKVVEVAEKKFPLRKINNNAKAVREILIDFVDKNKDLLTSNKSKKNQSQEA